MDKNTCTLLLLPRPRFNRVKNTPFVNRTQSQTANSRVFLHRIPWITFESKFPSVTENAEEKVKNSQTTIHCVVTLWPFHLRTCAAFVYIIMIQQLGMPFCDAHCRHGLRQPASTHGPFPYSILSSLGRSRCVCVCMSADLKWQASGRNHVPLAKCISASTCNCRSNVAARGSPENNGTMIEFQFKLTAYQFWINVSDFFYICCPPVLWFMAQRRKKCGYLGSTFENIL